MPLLIQRRRLHGLRGLGYPVLPDSFNSASGEAFSFSPNTPDATIMSVLAQYGGSLPPDLAAKWAASGAAGSVANSPAPAVTPSGQPISTQTAAAIMLTNIANVAPGVYQCTMSDGTKHYCDQDGNPMSYTPPAATPAVTPAAASQPTAVVSPSVTPTPAPTPQPGQAPVAITPSGQVISTTSGTPAPAPVAAPSGDIMLGTFDLSTFLTGSVIGGIPNWVLLAGGAAMLAFFGGSEGSHRRR